MTIGNVEWYELYSTAGATELFNVIKEGPYKIRHEEENANIIYKKEES